MLAVDLHIHSINSGHAYGTFYEIIAEAQRKKMKLIAITDHGPAMHGTISSLHFGMGRRAPEKIDDLRILWGCEANIISGDGELDLSPKIQEKLDIILACLHGSTSYVDLGIDGNTEALKRALHNPHLKILSHPLHPQYPCHLESIMQTALEQNVLLELNLSYLKNSLNNLKLFRRMVDMVREAGQKLIINSDAHFLHEIADDSILYECWEALGLKDELVLNNYPEKLAHFLNISL